MKKILAFLLLQALLISMCACAGSGETERPTEPVETYEITAGFSEELRQYLSPWNFNVVTTAKNDGRLHYYFMSSKGKFMEKGANYPYKWGDACLVVFPDGQTMLIDSGMEQYANVLVENLRRMGIKKLDYLVISHAHSDHAFGAVRKNSVLANFEVGQVFWSGIHNKSWGKSLIELACQSRNVPVRVLREGETLNIGQVQIQVLWPKTRYIGETFSEAPDINNNSIVMRLDFKEHSSLFTGDLYVQGECDLMVAHGKQLDVDLLKVPHHGHDTSSSPGFVKAISPELAVATGYIEASQAIQSVYEGNGATFLYDYADGYIHVSTDGETMQYETELTR